jgi:hypothetical protein
MQLPIRRLLVPVVLALGGLIPAANAQQSTDGAEQPDWYQVEVVIFRQWEQRGPDAETWPRDPVPPRDGSLVTLGPPASGPDAPAFSRLPGDALKLSGIASRLRKSSSYEVLLHVGWVQPGMEESSTRAVALPLDWKPPAEERTADWSDRATGAGYSPFDTVPASEPLYGSIRLIRQRYLHFEADLRYRRETSNPQPAADTADSADTVRIPEKTVTVYPLTQRERMRSGEIHYLDHPVLGIVVQARKVDHNPAPAPQSGAATAPAPEQTTAPTSSQGATDAE